MPETAIIPDEIVDEEGIGRLVFSPSMVVDGRLSPTAFKLRMLNSGPEEYVSVWRLNYITPTRENAIRPPKDNELFGYASIKAGECRRITFGRITVDVKPYPTKTYPFHAGIHFYKLGTPIKGSCQDPGFIGISKILANRCILVKI